MVSDYVSPASVYSGLRLYGNVIVKREYEKDGSETAVPGMREPGSG